MDENSRRRDLLRRQQNRLSYEDVSQRQYNHTFPFNNEKGNNAQNVSETMNSDFDSADENLSFENGASLSVQNTKKSSSSVTPR